MISLINLDQKKEVCDTQTDAASLPTVCGSSVYRYENAVDIATSTSTEQATAGAAEPDPEPVFAMEEGQGANHGCDPNLTWGFPSMGVPLNDPFSEDFPL